MVLNAVHGETPFLSLTLSSLALLAQDGFDADVFNQAKARAEAGFAVQKPPPPPPPATTRGDDGEGGDAEDGDGDLDRGALPRVLGTPSPPLGDDAGGASHLPSRASPPGTTRGDAPPNSTTLAGLSPLAPLSQDGVGAASRGGHQGAAVRAPPVTVVVGSHTAPAHKVCTYDGTIFRRIDSPYRSFGFIHIGDTVGGEPINLFFHGSELPEGAGDKAFPVGTKVSFDADIDYSQRADSIKIHICVKVRTRTAGAAFRIHPLVQQLKEKKLQQQQQQQQQHEKNESGGGGRGRGGGEGAEKGITLPAKPAPVKVVYEREGEDGQQSVGGGSASAGGGHVLHISRPSVADDGVHRRGAAAGRELSYDSDSSDSDDSGGSGGGLRRRGGGFLEKRMNRQRQQRTMQRGQGDLEGA